MAHELIHPIPPERETDVDALNQLIRGELAAADCYQWCIDEIGGDLGALRRLRELRDDHAARAQQLAALVRDLGADPATDAGPWGAFAQLVEAGAATVSNDAAVAALIAGESHGNNLYERKLGDLSDDLADEIREAVLPRQLRTHEVASHLRAR